MKNRVVTVAEMRALEAAADIAGVTYAHMMETAGAAVAARVIDLLRGREDSRVLVLVGPGNNGGDGLVAGRIIAEKTGANVAFALARPRDPEQDTPFAKVKAAKLPIIQGEDGEAVRALTAGADVIIDALLGTGAALPLRGVIKTMLDQVRLTLEARKITAHKSAPYTTPTIPAPPDLDQDTPLVIAVDLPSGMDADTGAIDPSALRADETITFETAKRGHFAFPGAASVGTLHIAPLNLPESLPEWEPLQIGLVDAPLVKALLPERPLDANKGTFGKALIIGGSENYIGAPGLAAMGAYRVGAGLVTVAAPDTAIPALAAQLLEVTWLPLPDGKAPDGKSISDAGASLAYTSLPDYSAALIGPGMGRTFNAYGLLETIFHHAGGNLPPLVIDADGLNMLATMEEWWSFLPRRTILTPHPGEMARLTKIKGDEHQSAAHVVQSMRLSLAREKAAEWGCVIVLKGAFTIIAEPTGRVMIQPFADPALARAGTGDVLAGAIVGLLAQGLDPFDAAVAGAYLHGYAGALAGQYLRSRASVLAGEVANFLPAALAAVENAG